MQAAVTLQCYIRRVATDWETLSLLSDFIYLHANVFWSATKVAGTVAQSRRNVETTFVSTPATRRQRCHLKRPEESDYVGFFLRGKLRFENQVEEFHRVLDRQKPA